MAETGDVGGLVDDGTCWCGYANGGETLVVERPPRLVLSTNCAEHGRIVRQGVAPDELVEVLEAGSGGSVRWPDLASAALCWALVAAGLPVPVLVVDLDAHTLFSNQAWSALAGLSSFASQGQRWLSALRNESAGTLIGAVTSDTATEVTISIGAHRLTSWTLLPQPILGGRGRPLGHVVLLVDESAAAAWRQGGRPPARSSRVGPSVADARHDAVARVDKALERQHGGSGTIALTLIQIEQVVPPEPTAPSAGSTARAATEHLIPVTDGDLLRPLAARLVDLTPAGDAMFELGGGCFAVLCEETSSYAETLELAQRLVDHAAEPLEAAPAQLPMRASVGIAFPHLPNETAEDVLANAERAVDAARSLGGRRVEVVIGTGPGSSDVARS